MATITVGPEREVAGAWEFQITIDATGAPPHTCTARLAWPDYDHWTSGSIAPATLIEHIARFIADTRPRDDWPTAFDAASVRRRYPQLTQYLNDNLPD